MTIDIVTRLRKGFDIWLSHGEVDDLAWSEAADEIERLRTLLNNTLERENKDNLRQLEIVRKVELDRDRWAKWGQHVFTCPNKGINPCLNCISPATADAMRRVNNGGV